jgi:serine/threonine-protein kinase
VIPSAQLGRAEASVPVDAATPAQAALALVTGGFLTRFQAERLLAGRTEGFNLGPYVIQEQVGRGQMGRVYKARHRTMNRSVALKVLSPELFQTTECRQRLLREVRAAARLNHPNLVTAYDTNEWNDRTYLALEFVDGPDFETLVRDRGPLAVDEACDLIRQAACGHQALAPADHPTFTVSRGVPRQDRRFRARELRPGSVRRSRKAAEKSRLRRARTGAQPGLR